MYGCICVCMDVCVYVCVYSHNACGMVIAHACRYGGVDVVLRAMIYLSTVWITFRMLILTALCIKHNNTYDIAYDIYGKNKTIYLHISVCKGVPLPSVFVDTFCL